MPYFEGLSIGGEKNAVVLDIGAAYTKCGLAGENGPRCIIPSEVKRVKTGQVEIIANITNEDHLYGCLVEFIHVLYFRHLLVNPKERRVVIVESVLSPTLFRNTLAKVLFKHYEVPSVLFAPSHLVALFTLGIPTGLVMDIGYAETLVLPVYEGVPILKAWQAIPVAGKSIHSYLEAQLLESATVRTDQMSERPLSSIMDKIDQHILEDIKVRGCFVTKMSRAQQISAAKSQDGGGDDGGGVEPPAPPPGLDYPLDGGKIMKVAGKVRENTCEVLFEMDNEEQSVATLLIDAILKCPVDMRKDLAENVIICGGTSMLPGFKSRLLAELKELVQKPKYHDDLAIKEFKFHQPPAKENYLTWLGGAIFGALEILGNRSVSKESYILHGTIPDWASLSDSEEKEDKPPIAKRS